MPYVLVSTQITIRDGPCVVGDEHGDPAIMGQLDATYTKQLGNNYGEWITKHSPAFVLNKLESLGYLMIGMTGVGQTCIWTCYKPGEKAQETPNTCEAEQDGANMGHGGDTSAANSCDTDAK